ncbi:hypothetical protein Nepgr_019232 [Nepenthes gracilis]|uniref:Cyclin N-terminal domain-containing protein n=1 Tax=Nepenthes gracilis TaxID=150966 RepID=A0AAD3SWK5_NEPGR|nr:hypothetical protein Nepgr_019232 [Nepenthes gracilis]
MTPSFDHAVSSLLCAEENSSILYDADNGLMDAFEMNTGDHRNHRTLSQDHGFNGGEGFIGLMPMQDGECLALMTEREIEHSPCGDYLMRLRSGDLDLAARREAVDWIWKVHSHYKFGPLCACLSINYLDRFISAYDLPKGKPWMMQLLAVACLSLAAKMEETEVPISLDLQIGESKFVFEAKTIQRMELLVLSTLKWRMQSITPFSFIDYFLYKLNSNQIPPRSSAVRSAQLITTAIKGIDFLEFRPSEIAAAVAISVTGETQAVNSGRAISFLIEHVQKERLLLCVERIHDLLLGNGFKVLSCSSLSSSLVPQTPIGVLDVACLSYKSDDMPTASCANSPHNTTSEAKRRKLDQT